MKVLPDITRESASSFFKKVTQPVWLLSIGGIFAAFGVYLIINHLVVPKYFIYCKLDDYIPFMADFALSYVYWFGYLPVAMVQMLWHREHGANQADLDFRRFILLYFISWAICLICYVAIPNGIDFRPTPDEIGFDTFCTAGLSLTYSGFDLPANVLPSLHCTSTIACCVGILNSRFVRRSNFKTLYYCYYLAFTILICISTVLVKQHSILDCFVSMALIAILYPLIYKVNWKKVFNRQVPASAE